MNKKKNQNNAFTLAEALITLLILGIIAALTIPGLTISMQKSEQVSGMKKAYSTLANATKKMNFANDIAEYKRFWDDENTFWNEISKQLNVMQFCNNNETGCFTKENIKSLNGNDTGTYDGKNYTLRTTDGYCYQYTAGTVEADKYGIEQSDAQKALGVFLVDVNGDAKPNTIGRDLYFFIYVEDKGIVPAGFFDDSNCNKNNSGYSCAGKILKDGKMKY